MDTPDWRVDGEVMRPCGTPGPQATSGVGRNGYPLGTTETTSTRVSSSTASTIRPSISSERASDRSHMVSAASGTADRLNRAARLRSPGSTTTTSARSSSSMAAPTTASALARTPNGPSVEDSSISSGVRCPAGTPMSEVITTSAAGRLT